MAAMIFPTIGTEAHEWAGRTYQEINDVADEAGSIAVLPVASVEQHGHHLPVGTDTILVDAVARLTGERAEGLPLLTLPPIWTGFSPHHVSFGGTTSVGFDTLHRCLTEVAASAITAGFDAVLLLNGHGGNISVVNGTASSVGADHPEAELLALTYFQLAAPFVDEIRESDPGGMGHGGEFETSLMLHLRPDLVREEQAHVTYRDEPYDDAGREMFVGGPLSVYRPFDAYTHEGQLGDPSLATAAKGHEIYRQLGDAIERVVRQIHRENAT